MDTAIELAGIRKSWPGFALDQISLALPRGYMMGLVGPNGAGKTTLVKLVLGLVRPDAGRLRVLSRDPAVDGGRVRARIGFVHDRPTRFDFLRVRRLAALIADFYPTWDQDLFLRLGRELELPLTRRVAALSRGMRVKLGLALALSHRAELLVLDEPTTGLDPVFRSELMDRLSALVRDEGTSVFLSTQILGDLERRADFVTVLRAGRVLFSGERDVLLDHWAVVRGGPELLAAQGDAGVLGMRRTRSGAEALVRDVDAARVAWGATAVVERATLDDVFLLLGVWPS